MLIRLYQSSFKLLAEICAWLALAMPTFLFLGSILVFFFGDSIFPPHARYGVLVRGAFDSADYGTLYAGYTS